MPLDICVVGSGIGGLACGIALADKGHNVNILEATKKMQAVGGIIIIMPNAERILDEWGVYPSILEICSDNPVPGYQRNYKHGEIIAKFPVDQMEEKLGFPCVKETPLQCSDPLPGLICEGYGTCTVPTTNECFATPLYGKASRYG